MGISFGNSTGKFFAGVSDSGIASAVNISVIGVGGAGGNIVKYLSEKNLPNVNLICANTDMQAMMETSIRTIIQLGKNTTRGLGSGSNPEIGEKSAIEASEEIKAALHGTDMLILIAGLGGGTGTGATPVISNIAREMGILTLTFAVTPFDFELERKELGERGINNLLKSTDSLITLSNQKLLSLYNDNLNFVDAFTMVSDIIYQAIMGVVNLLLKKELINRDFSDIVKVMKNKGHSIISIGRAKGDGRAITATTEALTNPLLSDVSIKGATGMIITICASQESLTLPEVNEVMGAILSETNARITKPTILFGTSFVEDLKDEIQVSIIATGLKSNILVDSDIENIPTKIHDTKCNDVANNVDLEDTDFANMLDPAFDVTIKNDENSKQSYPDSNIKLEDVKSIDSLESKNIEPVENTYSKVTSEDKRGFFSEFFSKSKSFDSLVNDSSIFDTTQTTDSIYTSKSESVEEFDVLGKSLATEALNFSLDNTNEDDTFFSDIENSGEDKEIELNNSDNKIFDSLDSEKEDNILFLTEKTTEKPKSGFYSKQVDIFELIDSITASK